MMVSMLDRLSAPALKTIALACVAISIAVHTALDFSPSSWKMTHYYFSFDDEFLKRALPGEFLRLFGPLTWGSVQIATFASLAVVGVVLWWSIAWLTRPLPAKDQAIAVFVFMGFPAFLGHLLLDFGRYDVFLVLLTLASVAISAKTRLWVSILCLILLQTAAILSHEIAILTSVPVSLLALLALQGDDAPVAPAIGSAVILGLVAAFVFVFGGSSIHGYEDLKTIYSNRYDGFVADGSLAVLFSNLADNVTYSTSRSFGLERIAENIIVIAFFIPFLRLTFGVIGQSPLAKRFGMPVLFILIFSPFLLSFVGHDQFRWWSFIFINLYVLAWVTSYTSEKVLDRFRDEFSHRQKSFLIFGSVYWFMGPLGVTHGFAIYH